MDHHYDGPMAVPFDNEAEPPAMDEEPPATDEHTDQPEAAQ